MNLFNGIDQYFFPYFTIFYHCFLFCIATWAPFCIFLLAMVCLPETAAHFQGAFGQETPAGLGAVWCRCRAATAEVAAMAPELSSGQATWARSWLNFFCLSCDLYILYCNYKLWLLWFYSIALYYYIHTMIYSYMLLYAIICYYMLSYAIICYYLLLYAIICYYMLLYAIICYYMLLYATICYYMLLYAIICYYMLLYAIICYYMLLYAIICITLQLQ